MKISPLTPKLKGVRPFSRFSLFVFRDPVQGGLNYWRERILVAVLAGGLSLSVVGLAPAIYMALTEKRWSLLAADLNAFLLVGLLLLRPQIGLKLRSGILLALLYLIGFMIIRDVGLISGGPAWLFTFAVIAGTLLGLKAALVAVGLNALTLLVFGLMAGAGGLLSDVLLISAGANFIFLNASAAIAVAVLVNGMASLNRRILQTTAALQSEQAELIKTREGLRQSEVKYRLLAENITDVIWTMDLDFRFTYVSPAVLQQQGWSPEEYQTHELQDILTPKSVDKVMAEFGRRMARLKDPGYVHSPTTLELEIKRKDGTTLWTEVTASFLLGEDNTPIGVLGVTRDITERRRAQKEKEALLERLSRSRKMEAIGTLAGGVAHDLNNVLSGVVSYPDLLLLDLPKESPLRRPIEVMQESGKKAAAIVQDLLTLARRGVAVSEVVNLNDLVNDHLASPEMERLKSFHPLVAVETHLDPELFNVLGSPVHLSKTIMNLVSNAAEAMPEGGCIRLSTENCCLEKALRGYQEVPPGDYVRLRVEDSGIGIAPEDLHRIFEPFYTKKKMGRSGTGLGMAVVWGTVQDHGGHIDLRSAEGRGTTVDLYFPLTRQEPALRAGSDSLVALRGKGEHVLVVDDIPEQREIAARIISQLGYAVTSAASGEEALAFLKDHRVDLVVLDMIMDPGIDGLETYRQVVRRHPHQKAIITSGFAETDRVHQAQKLGVGAYVRKPYTIVGLGTAIRSELAKTS